MLSKVAEHIYWMSRFLERSANIARFVEANLNMALDLPDELGDQWEPLIRVTGDHELYKNKYGDYTRDHVLRFLTFDADYPNSVVSCLIAARENARTIRDQISVELWEEINTMYHAVTKASNNARNEAEDPYGLYHEVKRGGMLMDGVAHETMTHGEGYLFFRIGRMLERADKVSRILDVKYFLILPGVDYVGTPYDDLQWAALLRANSGLETYRRRFGRISSDNIIRFLIFDPAFPRSILHCLTNADRCLRANTGIPAGSFSNKAEQKLGQLQSDLSYTSAEDVVLAGLHEFIDDLQVKMNMVDDAIYDTFFAVKNSMSQIQ